MDILLISNSICIILLFLASIQDILKKSVSDAIHYISIVFAISFMIFSLFKNLFPKNILFGYLILLLFLILYVLRYVAIGDVYIMFFLFYFLSFLSIHQIFKFLVSLSIFGSVMHSFEAIKIYYKRREYHKVLLFGGMIGIILISLYLFFYSLENLYIRYPLLLLSAAFLAIPLLIFKLFEEEIKESLTFKRKVEELVEGDWVEGEVEVKDISLLEQIKKNFYIIKKEGKYVIKLDHVDWKKRILILLLALLPLIFSQNTFRFIVAIIALIIGLTTMHNYFFRGELGLSKEQIRILKKICRDDDVFIVREGAPFIPAIFLAYVISIL